MKRGFLVTVAATVMAASMSLTAFAGTWLQNATGWWWQNDDGSYPTSCWQWLDGNGDGTAECYYFDEAGYMLANTVTPDGYTVNADGAWVVNGAVQTQAVTTVTETTTTSSSAVSGYPAPRHSIGLTVAADQTFDDALRASGTIVPQWGTTVTTGSDLIYVNYWWDPNDSFDYIMKAVGNLTPSKTAETDLKAIFDSACAIGITQDPEYGDPSNWDVGSTFEEAQDSIVVAIAIYYDSGLITAEQCAALGVTADQIQAFFSSEKGMSLAEFNTSLGI